MVFIKWNDKLSVKIGSIDREHKRLVAMINDFYKMLENQPNDELIADLIKKMKEYTIVHFSTEERLFKQFNFPESEAHIKEHQDFIDKVVDLEKRFNENTKE